MQVGIKYWDGRSWLHSIRPCLCALYGYNVLLPDISWWLPWGLFQTLVSGKIVLNWLPNEALGSLRLVLSCWGTLHWSGSDIAWTWWSRASKRWSILRNLFYIYKACNPKSTIGEVVQCKNSLRCKKKSFLGTTFHYAIMPSKKNKGNLEI